MTREIPIILLFSVAIVLAALFTVTQLMAGEKKITKRERIRGYQARTRTNQINVGVIKKKYYRNHRGCVEKVEFYNDLNNCAAGECANRLGRRPEICEEEVRQRRLAEEECTPERWVAAIPIDDQNWPKIWGEDLVGAGSTKGESGYDVCDEWRFTVAGSPGWDCDYIGGNIVCSCIGYYFPPPWDLCCQPTGCVPSP
jgi:hypothetical protein